MGNSDGVWKPLPNNQISFDLSQTKLRVNGEPVDFGNIDKPLKVSLFLDYTEGDDIALCELVPAPTVTGPVIALTPEVVAALTEVIRLAEIGSDGEYVMSDHPAIATVRQLLDDAKGDGDGSA